MHFDFRKGFVRIVDVLEMRCDLRKGSVMRLDVWYTHLHHWEGCLRMVETLEIRFETRKGYVSMVDVRYTCFDLCKDCVRMVDVQKTSFTQPLQRLKMRLSTSIPSSHLSPACQNTCTIRPPC